jgi:murein DD-endopeptidase MepM/ murein hydrolase activator NlpD
MAHVARLESPVPINRRPGPASRSRRVVLGRLLSLAVVGCATLGGGLLPRAAQAAPTENSVDPAVAAQQTLESGPPPGGKYVVQGDDTLTGIARRHGVSVEALVAANKLTDADVIREGQTLIVPAPVAAASVEAAVPIAAKPSPTPTPAPAFSPTSLVSTSAPGLQAASTGTPTVSITKKRIAQLVWPIVLKAPLISVTQAFQPGHSAIDIGAPTGTPIKAAAGGVVKVSEKADGAYGWRIVVDQGDDVFTWYAHLSELKVKEGQTVKAGDVIGSVGTSGLATGPHLHFELRIGSKPIDPRLALP